MNNDEQKQRIVWGINPTIVIVPYLNNDNISVFHNCVSLSDRINLQDIMDMNTM